MWIPLLVTVVSITAVKIFGPSGVHALPLGVAAEQSVLFLSLLNVKQPL
jgi:hypothetical protein